MKKNIIAAVLTAMLAAATGTTYSQIDCLFSRNDTVDVYVNAARTGAGYCTKGWFRITGCNQISDLYRKQFNRQGK